MLKKSLILSFLLLVFDQLLKGIAQTFLFGKKIIIFYNFGLTYVANSGVWAYPNISHSKKILLSFLSLVVWIIIMNYTNNYFKLYRKSIQIQLAFAFYTTSTFGNIIDIFVFNYIRDYLINPIAISNFADICVWLALICFIYELIVFPESRNIFKLKKERKIKKKQ